MPAIVRGRLAPHKPRKLHSLPLASANLDSGPGTDEEAARVLMPLPSVHTATQDGTVLAGAHLCSNSHICSSASQVLRNSHSWQAALWNTAWWGLFLFSSLLCKRLLWVVLCFNTEKWSCILHNKPFFITLGLNSNWASSHVSNGKKTLCESLSFTAENELSHAWNQITKKTPQNNQQSYQEYVYVQWVFKVA